MTDATPRPWTYDKTTGEILGPLQQLVADTHDCHADAALIVSAANAHDGLVSALETALRVVAQGPRIDSEQAHYLRKEFLAALAAAQEPTP